MLKTAELGGSVSVFVADASRMKCQLMVAALQRSRQRIVVVGSGVDSIGIRKGLRENREAMAETMECVDGEHGGAASLLRSIGIDGSRVERLRNLLLTATWP